MRGPVATQANPCFQPEAKMRRFRYAELSSLGQFRLFAVSGLAFATAQVPDSVSAFHTATHDLIIQD